MFHANIWHWCVGLVRFFLGGGGFLFGGGGFCGGGEGVGAEGGGCGVGRFTALSVLSLVFAALMYINKDFSSFYGEFFFPLFCKQAWLAAPFLAWFALHRRASLSGSAWLRFSTLWEFFSQQEGLLKFCASLLALLAAASFSVFPLNHMCWSSSLKNNCFYKFLSCKYISRIQNLRQIQLP